MSLLILAYAAIEHSGKAAYQSLIALLQHALGQQQSRIEANQRMPRFPLHHTFMQPLVKEQITGALPAPAQAQIAYGRDNWLDILQPLALPTRGARRAYQVHIIGGSLHVTGSQRDLQRLGSAGHGIDGAADS